MTKLPLGYRISKKRSQIEYPFGETGCHVTRFERSDSDTVWFDLMKKVLIAHLSLHNNWIINYMSKLTLAQTYIELLKQMNPPNIDILPY
jgi:hypothetical protein